MLSGKVAIVTGASRGIGRETALTLAGYGATVIVNYCGSKDKAEAVVEEIKAAGGNAKAYQGDVSDFDVAKEMITSVKKEFGSIDILVNNAGITKDNLIMRMSEEEFITKFYSCDDEEQFLKDAYHNLNCLRQENKQLKDNWNKLKECLKDVMNSSEADDKEFVETILDIMQEIENKK